MDAKFFHGDVISMDYTPATAVATGQVVVLGNVPYVSHADIPANALGALSIQGGAYKCVTDGTVAGPGVKVYWDNAAKRVTTTAGANKQFGLSGPNQAAAAAGTEIVVFHQPSGD